MAEYKIDDLAQAAKTTVRNVRSYQEKGLLPPPRRDGRAGVYSEIHLARLRLIGKMLDRGYSLSNIDELLEAWQHGQDIAQLMGFEDAIMSPFTTDVTSYISLEELYASFGASANAEALSAAVTMGILEIEHDRIKVLSPRLLRAGTELAKQGLPLPKLLHQVTDLRGDVRRIADRFVRLVLDEIFSPYGEDELPPRAEIPRLAELVRQLRPMAQMVVEIELARALEESVSATVGDRLARVAGKMSARKPAKAKKRK